jgi:RNA polymerase sigma-70 factor (ECF subfamily)
MELPDKHWIKKYSPRLLAYIRRNLDNPDEALDLLQETLISASQSLPTYSRKVPFFAWLCGIARHEISDYFRKKKIKTFLFSRLPFLEELADQAFGPEEEMVANDLKKRVKKVLASINEGYSAILRLKYIDGDSVKEIAKKLGLSPKAVESRLTRARVAFKKAWLYENEEIKNSKDFF